MVVDVTRPARSEIRIGELLFHFWDEGSRRPWDYVEEWETRLWHSRFIAYRDLGGERSMEGAWRKVRESEYQRTGNWWGGKKCTQAWYNASQRAHWKDRAEAWDWFQQESDRLARLVVAMERKRELDEKEWAAANVIEERVDALQGEIERVIKIIPLMVTGSERVVSDMVGIDGVRVIVREKVLQVNLSPTQVVNAYHTLCQIYDRIVARKRRALGLPDQYSVQQQQVTAQVVDDMPAGAPAAFSWEEHVAAMRSRQSDRRVNELEEEVRTLRAKLTNTGAG